MFNKFHIFFSSRLIIRSKNPPYFADPKKQNMTGVCFTLVTILLFDLFGGCDGLAVSQHTFLSPPHLPLEVPVKPRAVSQDVLGGVRTKEILSLQRQCQLDFVRGFGFVNFDGGIW